jgi:hypothetical protein
MQVSPHLGLGGRDVRAASDRHLTYPFGIVHGDGLRSQWSVQAIIGRTNARRETVRHFDIWS